MLSRSLPASILAEAVEAKRSRLLSMELRRAVYRVAFSSLIPKEVISLHEKCGNHV